MSEVKTSRKLLVSEILRGDPCYEYSHKVAERFSVEIEVTVELALSQADDWNWYWAASRLLTEEGYEKFSKIVNDAENSHASQLQPYRDLAMQAHAEAHIEYNRVLTIEVEKSGNWYSDAAIIAANVAYAQVTGVSKAALTAAREVVQLRVNKVQAKAFAELYISEEGTEEQTGNDRWYGRDDDYDEDYDENEDY